jgi:hypothetical protein
LIKQLSDSLEAYNGGSIDRLTTKNAAFDAKLNKTYAEMIASVKRREGKTSSDDAEHRVLIVQNEYIDGKSGEGVLADLKNGGNQCAFISSRRQDAGVNDPGNLDNDAISPSVSVDSDKTIETPQSFRDHTRGEHSSSPPLASKKKIAAKHNTSSTKSRPTKRSDSKSAVATTPASSRIFNLGPWNCDMCTFENLRNITKNSRCEMCDSVRPKESDSDNRKMKDAEIVEIDC